MAKIIVFEGLNGSGKTTVGTLVCEILGCSMVKTPSPIFGESRAKIDEKADLMARFLFYLAGTYQAVVDAVVASQELFIVFDRYYYSTVCSHRAHGLKVEIPSFLDFPKPDYSFLVTCQQEKRLARLTLRGLNINDLKERSDGIEKKTMEEFRSFNLTEIDNSSDSPMIAAREIISIVNTQ